MEQAVVQLRELLSKPESEGYRDALRLVIVEATAGSIKSLRDENAELKLWLEQAQTERDDLRERVGDLMLRGH